MGKGNTIYQMYQHLVHLGRFNDLLPYACSVVFFLTVGDKEIHHKLFFVGFFLKIKS